MATPTEFSVPPVGAESLVTALEDEIERQRKATPPPTFVNVDVVQSYDYLCELEHSKPSSKEVDQLRMSIQDPSYWKCEAQFYKEELSRKIWKRLVEQYKDSASEADVWRNVALAYTRRLNRHGFATKQVRQWRLDIEDQAYRKPEAEHLRKASAMAERTSVQNRLKRKAHRRGRVQLQNIAQKEPPRSRRDKQQRATASTAPGNDMDGRIVRRRSSRVPGGTKI